MTAGGEPEPADANIHPEKSNRENTHRENTHREQNNPAQNNPDQIPVHFSPSEALRELERIADFERRRGVRYWWDATLAEGLRSLVRDVSAPTGGRSPGRTGTAALGSVRAGTAPSSPLADQRRRISPINGGNTRVSGEHGTAASGEQGTAMSGEQGTVVPDEQGTPSRDESNDSGLERQGPLAAARSTKIPQWPVPPLATGRDPDWEERLAAVGRRANVCIACKLAKTRTNVVFGVGSAHVPLVFVGEAPGADEDAQGIPFVGRAGQLLTKIIAAIGLERDEVYICNILKCRPPGNRNPEPDEIACCTPYLQEQLAILKPRVICTLGLFASQYLLQSAAPIGKLRGRIFDYHGIPLIPTYHPAALLRNPALKANVWEDVQLVRRTLDAA